MKELTFAALSGIAALTTGVVSLTAATAALVLVVLVIREIGKE